MAIVPSNSSAGLTDYEAHLNQVGRKITQLMESLESEEIVSLVLLAAIIIFALISLCCLCCCLRTVCP